MLRAAWGFFAPWLEGQQDRSQGERGTCGFRQESWGSGSLPLTKLLCTLRDPMPVPPPREEPQCLPAVAPLHPPGFPRCALSVSSHAAPSGKRPPPRGEAVPPPPPVQCGPLRPTAGFGQTRPDQTEASRPALRSRRAASWGAGRPLPPWPRDLGLWSCSCARGDPHLTMHYAHPW